MNTTLSETIAQALKEDIASGDLSASLIAANTQIEAKLICREAAILCGVEWFDATFHALDNSVQINWLLAEGQLTTANQELCQMKGNASSILTAERTAINFLQLLSSTATITHQFVSMIKDTNCKLLDTRKTIPGLRCAQKYAVKCGGGYNHRMGLYDAILIKENHIAACGSISKAVAKAKALHKNVFIEVEVENLLELDQALSCHVDRIMLDNFTLADMEKAVKRTDHQCELEASGGINKSTIHAVAKTGVDYISVGELTKNVRAIDYSLLSLTSCN